MNIITHHIKSCITTFHSILSIAFVLLLLVACSAGDDANPSQPEPKPTEKSIIFDAGYTASSESTRAELNDLNSLKANGFYVYANARNGIDEEPVNFMHNQIVSWNQTTTKWEYEPLKLWPTNQNATVDYYAAYKGGTADADNISVLYDWYNKPHTIFYVNNTVSKQTDMLWAAPVLAAKASNYGIGSPVMFQFKHALAGFYFTIILNAAQPDGTKVYVNSLTLSGYFAPKAEVVPDETDVKKAFKLQGDWIDRSYTISKDGDNEVTSAVSSGNGISATIEQEITSTKGYIMVLPFAQEYTVTLNYSINDGTGSTTYSVSKKIQNVTDLVAGNMLKTKLILTPGAGPTPPPTPPPSGGGNLDLKVTLIDWVDVAANAMEIEFE